MLGWNRRGPIIACELSRYVAPGSLLTIAADTPELEEEIAALSRRQRQSRRRISGASTPPAAPRSKASTSLPTTTCWCWAIATSGGAAGRHPHAGDAAAPAQDRRRCGQAYQRRQRDDRRAQPRARRSHPRRRFRGQQQAGQPDAGAGLARTNICRRSSTTCSTRRARKSTCGRPRDYVDDSTSR